MIINLSIVLIKQKIDELMMLNFEWFIYSLYLIIKNNLLLNNTGWKSRMVLIFSWCCILEQLLLVIGKWGLCQRTTKLDAHCSNEPRSLDLSTESLIANNRKISDRRAWYGLWLMFIVKSTYNDWFNYWSKIL
jgi:hypothetical protein